MTDSPFGPVRKWGTPWTPDTDDLRILDAAQKRLDQDRLYHEILALNAATWEVHVTSAIGASKPLSHPANLGQLDDADIEPLDRGSANALGNGIVAALLVFVAPFALYGAWTVALWWWGR